MPPMWLEWQKCANRAWFISINVIREKFVLSGKFYIMCHHPSFYKWESLYISEWGDIGTCHGGSFPFWQDVIMLRNVSSFFGPDISKTRWRELLLLTWMTGNKLCTYSVQTFQILTHTAKKTPPQQEGAKIPLPIFQCSCVVCLRNIDGSLDLLKKS